MRYGIFADVHSNLEAIEAVEKALKDEGIDEYFCLGDIVGYGANPSKCISKVKKLTSVILAGNHDWAAAEKFDISYFNPYAKEAILWTRQKLSEEEKKFLSNLPLVYETQLFVFVHATLNHPENFDYVLDIFQAKENFRVQKTPFCFIAHSHSPEIYICRDELVSRENNMEVLTQEGNKYLINVGSVGQPRDGDPRACYCIFDTDKKTISIRRVEYDVKKAHDKILAAGLPIMLAYRLLEGR